MSFFDAATNWASTCSAVGLSVPNIQSAPSSSSIESVSVYVSGFPLDFEEEDLSKRSARYLSNLLSWVFAQTFSSRLTGKSNVLNYTARSANGKATRSLRLSDPSQY